MVSTEKVAELRLSFLLLSVFYLQYLTTYHFSLNLKHPSYDRKMCIIKMQGSPNILSEGHIRYYTTVRGLDILFGICHSLPNQRVSRKYIIFSLLKNIFAGRMKWLCRP